MFSKFTIFFYRLEYKLDFDCKVNVDDILDYILTQICRFKGYALEFDSSYLELCSTIDIFSVVDILI